MTNFLGEALIASLNGEGGSLFAAFWMTPCSGTFVGDVGVGGRISVLAVATLITLRTLPGAFFGEALSKGTGDFSQSSSSELVLFLATTEAVGEAPVVKLCVSDCIAVLTADGEALGVGVDTFLAGCVGCERRLLRVWCLRGWSARYRRIARHLREDGTVSPED